MMTSYDARREITILFNKYDALARSKYPAYAAMGIPKLRFFTKGRAAGWAHRDLWTVEINEYVGAQNITMIENTVSHEIAHMVDYALRGRSGHDAQWKAIHRSLGGSAERCYNPQEAGVKVIPGRVTNQYLYRNAKGDEVWLGPKYHAKFQRNWQEFTLTRAGVVQHFRHSDYTGQSRKKN